jgi:membrane protein insertase Oxa1/YidC/SpoIIIJ
MDLGQRVSAAVSEGIATGLPYLGMLAVMVASQYIQTWHATSGQARPDNPQAAAGQTVSRIMPLFIGIVSYNFPAGLVLYWMTGNIFRLLQQIVIFKIDGRPQFAPVESSRQSGEKDGSGGKTEDRGQTAEGRKPPQGAADKRRRRKRR